MPLLAKEEQKIIEKVEDEVDLYVARKSQKSVRLSMALNLTEKQILRSHKCWPTFLTTFGYLLSEQSKKARSFQIGVFTIFLVVSFLTLLKSAVDVAPVAFVKIASDQSGLIDFELKASDTLGSKVVDGNGNFL